MTAFVPRTCTEIGGDGSSNGPERRPGGALGLSGRPWGEDWPVVSQRPRSLEDFRERDACVLLGAPGAGKTVEFEREADECEDGCYVTARDFITFADRPEWHGTTLFIDGLDEVRAGAADGRTPLDAIRAKLDALGRPRFRLSCREADWFGASDRQHLESVSARGEVTVLRLDPLSGEGIRELLGHRSDVEDADEFVAEARERGIDSLLASPQSLRMLAEAVAGGTWPETRMETFALACEKLVREQNADHRCASRDRPATPELLTAAGRLCALQLLTGAAGYALPGGEPDDDYPGLEQIPEDRRETLRHALGTRLFESPGEGRLAPVHRQVAEFLAARYLAGLIDCDHLPAGRVLALMTGGDGGVVSELRGLSAWLAAHSKTSRTEIVARDPLGTVLYGDVRGFSSDEKRGVLSGLERLTERKPWFRETVGMDSRLGALAALDMGEVFRSHLRDCPVDDAGQRFLALLLQSLIHGASIPGLAGLLMEIVRDDGRWSGARRLALDAFIRHGGSEAPGELKNLLADVQTGAVSDEEHDLLGTLLSALYPESLSPAEILPVPEALRTFIRFVSGSLLYVLEIPGSGALDECPARRSARRARGQVRRVPLCAGGPRTTAGTFSTIETSGSGPTAARPPDPFPGDVAGGCGFATLVRLARDRIGAPDRCLAERCGTGQNMAGLAPGGAEGDHRHRRRALCRFAGFRAVHASRRAPPVPRRAATRLRALVSGSGTCRERLRGRELVHGASRRFGSSTPP